MNSNPLVSIIINTTNRAYHLKRLLDCLSHQTYDLFEVIVVNGPSVDCTDDILSEYSNCIRIAKCSEKNLCLSRNIGWRMAAGEVIAYIDDDAVPYDKYWLAKAVSCFNNENVGIVSGESINTSGEYEFRYGTCSIYGDQNPIQITKQNINNDSGLYYGIRGNNMFISKKALESVGGFDEYYVYFLDETDLAIRIQQAGFQLRYSSESKIVHESANGDFRKNQYDLNWEVIARSQGYFTIKFTENLNMTKESRETIAFNSGKHWLSEFDWLAKENKITKEQQEKYSELVIEGLKQGIADGFVLNRQLSMNDNHNIYHFRNFKDNYTKTQINICLLCEDDILTARGGVAVYTKSLAYGLAISGRHNVYVITSGTEEKICNVKGVNICTIVPEKKMVSELEDKPISLYRMNFAYHCYKKLQELKKSFFVDIVESPIWDSLGLVCACLEKDIPVVTRLQTPLKMYLKTFNKTLNGDFQMLMEYEKVLMDKSYAIITISDCIKKTIEENYNLDLSRKSYKNYLGISPRVNKTKTREDSNIVVFFIGRLERRKGIDSIIAVLPKLMEEYPNLEFRFAGDDGIIDESLGMTYKDKLISMPEYSNWKSRVHFLGVISDEQKEQEFANCDIFVSPSLYESFGIIFIEAMRFGKPVIGCRCGGMQEVIEDGVSGLLCEPGDSDSFYVMLKKLIDNPELRNVMGQAGLIRLKKMFSEESMCNSCEEIYREVIYNYSAEKHLSEA